MTTGGGSAFGMTLEQKIGQMVMMGVPGTTIGEAARTLIQDYHVGGIMLFAENVDTPEQVARFTAGLQRMADEAGAGVPLFVSIDQEGGKVVRIKDGVTPLPSHMAIGATGSAALAERVGGIVGAELAVLGINMNAAPVMDVNNNPHNPVIGTRSFGENAHAVAELGTAFMRGMQAAGVLAIAKHFPGHGDTDVDSHLALPTIAHARARLDEVELVPFRAAIAAGVNAIMSAHITFPAVDDTPGLPSTLSDKVLTGLLRRELGFDGIIITDALEMKGITSQYAIPEAAVKAVLAGADIVLIAQSKYNEEGKRAVKALVRAVQDGVIPLERVDESVARIVAAKGRLSDAASSATLAAESSLAAVRDVVRHAATVVRNDAGVLPLAADTAGRVLLVAPALNDFVMAEPLRRRLADVTKVTVPLDPDDTALRAVVAAARGADTIIVATAGVAAHPGQAALVRAVAETGQRLIVVSTAEPYDLIAFPQIATYVAAYGWDALHTEAAVDVMVGRHPARGRLPVSIPGLYEAGHGISPAAG